jgi:hypothetical protein
MASTLDFASDEACFSPHACFHVTGMLVVRAVLARTSICYPPREMIDTVREVSVGRAGLGELKKRFRRESLPALAE